MRTQEEIDIEIAALKEIKPRIRERNGFGEDNHAAIDCQIEVLERKMDEGEVWDRNENAAEDELFVTDRERDNAMEAVRWLAGEDEVPSEAWKEML